MLDVSLIKKVNGANHWFSEINQLYHPTGKIQPNSQALVYSLETINKTKFIDILLKEWFSLVNKSGFLVIDYEPNKLCDWQKLEEKMWWLFKGKYEIVYHSEVYKEDLEKLSEKKLKQFIKKTKKTSGTQLVYKGINLINQNKKLFRFVCQRITVFDNKEDDISKWTFGIITNGKRNDWMELVIKSICQQNIPNFEIIVCGKYFNRPEKNFKYIPFSERDNNGWITKKKNILVQKAKYENLCILHDRVVLGKNWYSGMKKWGNCFEMLSCAQKFENKRALIDWPVWENTSNDYNFGFASSLEYKDWDKKVYQSGQLHILKKFIANEIKWNETCYWMELEDLKISKDAQDRGYLLRLNPYSECELFNQKYLILPRVDFDNQIFSPKRSGDTSQIRWRKIFLFLAKNKFFKKIILYFFEEFPARKIIFGFFFKKQCISKK